MVKVNQKGFIRKQKRLSALKTNDCFISNNISSFITFLQINQSLIGVHIIDYNCKTMQKSEGSTLDKIRRRLQEKWSLNNIWGEIEVITNMNRHLEIAFDSLTRIDILRKLQKDEVMQILKGIPFIRVFINKNTQQETVRLQYQNASRLLLVSGMQKHFVDQMVSKFNKNSKQRFQKVGGTLLSVKLINKNRYWYTLQTSSQQAAEALKKYMRNEKKRHDQTQKVYRIQGKRVRIIIASEDLLTLLIDSMIEYKSYLFKANFVYLPEPRNIQALPTIPSNKRSGNIYYRQLVTNDQESYNLKTEQKEEQFSDGFSQSNSLSSDIIETSKMKDIIETSDQGIQSQNNIASPADSFYNNQNTNQSFSLKQLREKQQQIMNNALKSSQKSKQQGQPSLQSKSQNGINEISKERTQHQTNRQDLLCTEKHSPPYISGQIHKNMAELHDSSKQGFSQTQESLYTALSYVNMRKMIQQFKNQNHSALIQLPEWMKCISQKQRFRHRFFSSLCKPKLINQKEVL